MKELWEVEIPVEDQAKEFESTDRLDDSDAFEEHLRSEEGQLESDSLRATPKWRAGKSLLKLRSQLDKAYPDRNKASDGLIGDAAHCPNPDGTGSSDHCPNIQDGDYRIVTAYDATNDPKSGCDMNIVIEAIRESRDSRVKYIIWNKRICNPKSIGGNPPWAWRPYSGSNPHSRHAHISVSSAKSKYDDDAAWSIFRNQSAEEDLTG